MPDTPEGLSGRFFASVGLVEPAGYRTIEVLLDKDTRQYFGGRDHFLLAFTPNAARENPEAELFTYGSPLLDAVVEAATVRGNTAHFYLKGLRLSRGRTFEKVRAQARLPGHLLEVGEEQTILFHHALFRFKVSIVAEEREEVFRDAWVDLHTGWAAPGLPDQILRLYASVEPLVYREMKVQLSLREACLTALKKVHGVLAPQLKAHKEALEAACQLEQRQMAEHYQAIVARLAASQARKGANPEAINDKIRATQKDWERRREDVEKRYQLRVELALSQLGLISYPKTVSPVRLRQGKDQRLGMAIWDSLFHEGYFAPF